MDRGAKTGVGIAVAAVVVVVFALGPVGAFLGGDGGGFGSPSRLDELGPEYADGRATIEATVADTGTGRFTAKAIAVCAEGEIVRLGSGRTADHEWVEDEYHCGGGSFIIRTDWPSDASAVDGVLAGTWMITMGTDDYGDLVGRGDAAVSTVPGQPDVLTGTIEYDF